MVEANPTPEAGWVTAENLALLVDEYELTMAEAYLAEGMTRPATFSLFCRRLPPSRSYLVACGLEQVLAALSSLSFSGADLEWLAGRGRHGRILLDWLSRFRFDGEVRAVPEGTPVFAGEPLLEVTAPLPAAQLVESLVMNQMHVQTVVASKAARIVEAAAGRSVVDFGLRRTHGADAAVKAARAAYVAGVSSTSNVLAGRLFGVPVTGTMAHSYVQAHDDEASAFAAFVRIHPGTTILVDTYDTLEGVRRFIRLHREAGEAFRPRAIRLDSGDLRVLAVASRRLLDDAGLGQVRIVASSGLDEHAIAALLEAGAPIDAFGVGTAMGTSTDAPALDLAYKLTEYDGVGRVKLSADKPILPGRKQIHRVDDSHDLLSGLDEKGPGRPLLAPVMQGGRILEGALPRLGAVRAHAAAERARLPARLRGLSPTQPPFEVRVSAALMAAAAAAAERNR